MANPAAFWNWMAKRYSKTPISNLVSYAATLERTRSHLHDEMRVIEIGCGTGSTALELAPYVGHVTATDFSEKMIEIAKKKAKKAGVVNVTFEVADANAINVNIYDVVLAHNILHLVPDIGATIAHARSLLSEGGLFISKTPCLGPQRYFLAPIRAILRFIPMAPRPHLIFAEQLEDAIRAAGFDIVESGQYPKGQGAHYVVARRMP